MTLDRPERAITVSDVEEVLDDAMSEDEFESEILAMERTKTRDVSLRLPLDLIERTKAVAPEQPVPYQTLMKAFIDGGVRKARTACCGKDWHPKAPINSSSIEPGAQARCTSSSIKLNANSRSSARLPL